VHEIVMQLAGGRRSRLRVGRGAMDLLGEVGGDGVVALVGDDNVMSLYGERAAGLLEQGGARVITADFPAGEASKTRLTKEALEDRLLAHGLDRGGKVVALGGGVSTDLAGYVAATYMRAVPWVAVPTSLLAMVDASVGGKTGVNTPFGKNLVGAFHQPAEVLMDPDLLGTLPRAERRTGLAELLKHGVVADRELFEQLEHDQEWLARGGAVRTELLVRAVQVKARIVQQDELEAGQRAVLNFGHTVGHAVEAASEHAVAHGAAVALGMKVEARAAVELCGLPREELTRLEWMLSRLGLLQGAPALTFEQLEPHLMQDKKNRGGSLRAALPARLGQMAGQDDGCTVAVPVELLRRLWQDAGA